MAQGMKLLQDGNYHGFTAAGHEIIVTPLQMSEYLQEMSFSEKLFAQVIADALNPEVWSSVVSCEQIRVSAAMIEAGIKALHFLIDENLEDILADSGDESYAVEITEATDVAFPGRSEKVSWDKKHQTWLALNKEIEGEWDRMLRLYYAEGLRGEELVRAAKTPGR